MVKTKTSLKKTLAEVEKFLRSKIKVETIFLFGSYVSGTPHKYSDIDIAVFSPDIEKMNIEEKAKLAAEVKLKIDSAIELHLFPAKSLKEARPTNFCGYILRTGKRIT